jgi:NAD(P)-dependent dehydrogenase (short-subunit alcohol dehydrogenase family)
MQIENSVALITGANGGIGQQLIKVLQSSGISKIYACARNPQILVDLEISDPDRIVSVQLDVTDLTNVADAAAQCQDVNLLINNAGISRDVGLIAAPDLSGARLEMETNYFGTLAMCRAFAPVLQANGGGTIVNLLSIVAQANLPFMGSYCASKAAELSLTHGIRAELSGQGTLVVGVMPGTVDTKFASHYPPPKVSPDEVAREALRAVLEEIEEIYPGEQASYLAAELLNNPKGVEKQLAGLLPNLYPFV